MKILVLYHTAWIESMLKSWQREGKVEVAALPLPVVDWDDTPGYKDKIAKLIVDYAMVWRPDFILDINGVGVLPVAGEARWTPELALVPWVEWWFEDPCASAALRRSNGALEPWLKAIGCPLVRNFIWDAVLAREYSEWTGKKWTHLPSATDPEIFSPDAAEGGLSSSFEQHDICFFGSCFPEPVAGSPEFISEISHLLSLRVISPERGYFEIFHSEPKSLRKLSSLFAKAKRRRWGAFDQEILAVKRECNEKTAYFLRSGVLVSLAKLFPSRLFVGDGYPKGMKASTEKLYIPAGLSACYASATLSLDLASSQSFTGTNMRAYEIMSAGGALACNRRPDFDPEGKLEGKAYFLFEKPEALPALCERLKAEPSERSAVQAEARRLVRKAHTWNHRLAAMLESLKQQA